MRDSGLSIHFQDDNDSERREEKHTEKENHSNDNKREKKVEKTPEKNLDKNRYHRLQMILIIVITFELISIFLFLPVILMGR